MRVGIQVVTTNSGSAVSRYVGTIEAVSETPLSMQSAGRVEKILCHDGDRVRRGQVILRIDSTQAVHAMQAAEATLRRAQDGYDRVMQVYAKGGVTDQKIVEIESQLTQARSVYESAKQQVRECTLVAPGDGLVQGLEIEEGQTVVPGVRLCSILDMSAFCVRFTVPETEIGSIKAKGDGTKGEVECAAVNRVLPIVITEKSMKANPLTHTYEVTARIKGGVEELMPGMVATVKLKGERLTTQGEDIVIPSKCVLLKPEGPTVWVAEQGKAQRRFITIDGYLADGVRVVSGLETGDSLITDGYQKLYQGAAITER